MTRTTKAQEKQSKVRRQSQWRHQTLHIQLNCLLWEQLIMSTAIWLCAGKLLAGNELPHTGTTLNAPSVFLRFHTSSKSNVKGMYYYICYLGTDSLIQALKLKAEKCRFVPSRENWQWATMQRTANKLTTTLKKMCLKYDTSLQNAHETRMLLSMWIHQLCHHFLCVDGYERKDADVYFRAVSNEWSQPYYDGVHICNEWSSVSKTHA